LNFGIGFAADTFADSDSDSDTDTGTVWPDPADAMAIALAIEWVGLGGVEWGWVGSSGSFSGRGK